MNIDWKKIGLNLIYPHLAVIICLLPLSVAFLVFSLIYLGTKSIIAIISYLLAFYVLLVICFRIPRIINFFKEFKRDNKYLQRWFSDVHLRITVSLYVSFIFNLVFAIFQLGLGFYHKSFWFFSLFAYYIILAVVRFYLVNYTRKNQVSQQSETEINKYILCGWVLLFINIVLAGILFFMVYFNRTFYHNMITTIAMAAYTFTAFTIAIVNIVKFRKYKSPVYTATKCISLIAGAVSILTLESTMLTTFGAEASPLFSQIMLSCTGVVVIGFAITVSIIMIVTGIKSKRKNTLN